VGSHPLVVPPNIDLIGAGSEATTIQSGGGVEILGSYISRRASTLRGLTIAAPTDASHTTTLTLAEGDQEDDGALFSLDDVIVNGTGSGTGIYLSDHADLDAHDVKVVIPGGIGIDADGWSVDSFRDGEITATRTVVRAANANIATSELSSLPEGQGNYCVGDWTRSSTSGEVTAIPKGPCS